MAASAGHAAPSGHGSSFATAYQPCASPGAVAVARDSDVVSASAGGTSTTCGQGLMSLSIGVLTSADGPFYDIRELSETAEEVRQRALAEAREQGRKSHARLGRAT